MSAVVADFLAGSIIPLPFFPEGVRQLAELLPFAAMQNMPLRIYSGSITGMAAIHGILFQLIWCLVLWLCGKLWMAKTLRRVVIQGG